MECQDNGTLDHVGQFPDVAWPVVQHEALHGLRCKALYGLATLSTKALQEVIGKQRDVFASFAQRGEEEGNDMDTIVEILAKPPLADCPPQVLVRRGNEAEVAFDRSPGSQGRELMLLEYPQEFALQGWGKLGDFVEKYCALISLLEQALGKEAVIERLPESLHS